MDFRCFWLAALTYQFCRNEEKYWINQLEIRSGTSKTVNSSLATFVNYLLSTSSLEGAFFTVIVPVYKCFTQRFTREGTFVTGVFFDMQILLRTFSEYVVKTAEKFKPPVWFGFSGESGTSVTNAGFLGRKNAPELIEGH